jgi:hypothetical protein
VSDPNFDRGTMFVRRHFGVVVVETSATGVGRVVAMVRTEVVPILRRKPHEW